MSAGRVIHGDTLAEMAGLPEASVDLVYLDPPYNTGCDWRGAAGAFSDKWEDTPELVAQLGALADVFAGSAPGMRGYLGFMAGALRACHRLLKPTGHLWLQCDDHARAELRVLLDFIFGARFWRGDHIWRRADGMANRTRGFARVHDTLILMGRDRLALSIERRFPGWGRLGAFGLQAPPLAGISKERVGYPTQKPLALLELLIEATSFPGQVVLDPMCGSGTTLVAALRCGREAIGIDASADAVEMARQRIERRGMRQIDLFGAAA